MAAPITMAVQAKDIAVFLGASLQGPDVPVHAPRSLDSIESGALVFAKAESPERTFKINGCPGAVALVTPDFAGKLLHSHIVVEKPRLAFALAVQYFFAPKDTVEISRTAQIDPSALIDEGVSIGHYSTIGANVRIGADTTIRHHVVIGANTRVGKRCLIKSHAVLGEEGFGFATDVEGRPVRLPHLGIVELGDDVEVGAGTIIARATTDATRIGNRVKMDDHVFVAHNVEVGDDTLITAAAEISGSVKIGRGCWIGPNATIINRIAIGDRAFVGIGAVVTRDVRPGAVVVGNPARFLKVRDERSE